VSRSSSTPVSALRRALLDLEVTRVTFLMPSQRSETVGLRFRILRIENRAHSLVLVKL
jgi:hypothetical protein